MDSAHLNRACTLGLTAVSLGALFLVLMAVVPIAVTGVVPPPRADEGALARLFQISIFTLLPLGLLFLGTADWTGPARVARRLVVPTGAVVTAFALLYCFEGL
jgi:hypothetical protein